jgi:chromosome segregation ATPase
MNTSLRISVLTSAILVFGYSALPSAIPGIPSVTGAFGSNGDALEKVEIRHSQSSAYSSPRARLALPKESFPTNSSSDYDLVKQANEQLRASQERFVLEVSRLRQKVRALEHRNAMTGFPINTADFSSTPSSEKTNRKQNVLSQEITKKLLNEIHRLRIDLGQKQQEISKLQSSQTALKRGAENDILREQQEVLMDRIIQLQRRLRSKMTPIADGNLNQRDETLLRVKELELALAKREDRIAELQEKHHSSLQNQSSESQKSRKELLAQLRSSQEELQQQLAYEKQRADKLEKQYRWAKQEVRSLRHFSQERRKLNQNLLSVKNEKRRLEVEVAALKSLDEQNDSLRHRLSETRNQLNDIKAASQEFIQKATSERDLEILEHGVRKRGNQKTSRNDSDENIEIDVPRESNADIDVQDVLDEEEQEISELVEPGTDSSSQLGFR